MIDLNQKPEIENFWLGFAHVVKETFKPLMGKIVELMQELSKILNRAKPDEIPAPKAPNFKNCLHKPVRKLEQPFTRQPRVTLKQPRRDKQYFWRS